MKAPAPGANRRGARLPTWARATARDLPRTTAAMLELDRLHRTKSPLGPSLRGKMRWVAADANRCEYARATAEADLRRVGVSEAEIADLKAGPKRWPEGEREALGFARQMTDDASLVTDAWVAELKAVYGDEKLVAMVLLIAAANFPDADIEGLRKHYSDHEVAEIVYHATQAAFFDRLTEAAGLRLEP